MNSSIVRHLNRGNEAGAADAFLLYDKAAIESEKRPVAVLTQRRIKERYLFLAS
jgi:GH24 family phage-related lysozyme (muramidase)